MLNGTLTLHGVDTEALCHRVIRSAHFNLTWSKHDDLLAYLISVAWELSTQYDPDRHSHGFLVGCTRLLRLRTIDWIRHEEGRTRQQRNGTDTRIASRYGTVSSTDAESCDRSWRASPMPGDNNKRFNPHGDGTDLGACGLRPANGTGSVDLGVGSDPGFKRALIRGHSPTHPPRNGTAGAGKTNGQPAERAPGRHS
jgi:hypothetical protein